MLYKILKKESENLWSVFALFPLALNAIETADLLNGQQEEVYKYVNRFPYSERHFFIDTVQQLKETLRDFYTNGNEGGWYFVSSDHSRPQAYISPEGFLMDRDVLKFAMQWIAEEGGHFCLLPVKENEKVLCSVFNTYINPKNH